MFSDWDTYYICTFKAALKGVERGIVLLRVQSGPIHMYVKMQEGFETNSWVQRETILKGHERCQTGVYLRFPDTVLTTFTHIKKQDDIQIREGSRESITYHG